MAEKPASSRSVSWNDRSSQAMQYLVICTAQADPCSVVQRLIPVTPLPYLERYSSRRSFHPSTTDLSELPS